MSYHGPGRCECPKHQATPAKGAPKNPVAAEKAAEGMAKAAEKRAAAAEKRKEAKENKSD